MLMKRRTIIGVIFVVASLVKLASIWGLIHWSWLERAEEEPWAVYFGPFLLIYIGLHLIVEGILHDRDLWLQRPLPDSDEGKRLRSSVYFGGDEYVYCFDLFRGALLQAFCGGIRLDLREAVITEDEEIDIRTIFGGVELIVPRDVAVEVRSRSIIGGVGNETDRNVAPDAPCLHIVASNYFGGVSVKN